MRKYLYIIAFFVLIIFLYQGIGTAKTRVPLIVMIDNHKDARPQYGIGKADIVYEALAEGGITRFMAIFIGEDVTKVGPVRSAREYFVKLAYPYKGLYAHCGGSPYAYIAIKKLGVHDLDQLTHGKYFKRDHTKKSPHNLFTSTNLLNKAVSFYHISPPIRIPFFGAQIMPIKEEKNIVKKVYIKYNRMYAISYLYNSEKNRYIRYTGKTIWKDALTREPISTENVIILFVPSHIRKNDKEGRLKMNIEGMGRGLLFTGGGMESIKWVKHPKDPIFLMTKSGERVKLNPGKVWIQIIPPGKGEISYK